jgi:hypothetical protein
VLAKSQGQGVSPEAAVEEGHHIFHFLHLISGEAHMHLYPTNYVRIAVFLIRI